MLVIRSFWRSICRDVSGVVGVSEYSMHNMFMGMSGDGVNFLGLNEGFVVTVLTWLNRLIVFPQAVSF